MIVNTDIKGDIALYPNAIYFSEDEKKYLIKRLEIANNVYIKSRYAHIL